MPISDYSEVELIERLRSIVEDGRPPGDELPLGIGDDTAVLSPPSGGDELFTIDTMVEGVHFRLDLEPPEDVGFKLVAINASDVAAMGGRPYSALLSLALSGGLALEWFESLCRGVRQGGEACGIRVLGGDTTRSPSTVVLSLAMLGVVREGGAVRRDGAKPGDVLVVTGGLGNGRAGREALERGERDKFPAEVAAYLRPTPRIEEGLRLAEAGRAHAMIDVSDGLASETYHLARMSRVSIEIDGPALPFSDGVRSLARAAGAPVTDYALYGGEDYQLLAAVPPDMAEPIAREFESRRLARLTRIGRVTGQGDGVWLLDGKGGRKPLKRLGFDHFGEHRI